MKIALEIPDCFLTEYDKDKFEETFDRVIRDMGRNLDEGYFCLAGNYEKETLIMLRDALINSKAEERR